MPTSEVIFKATDTGAATVKAATENLKRMRQEKVLLQNQTKVLTGDLKGMGSVMNATGNIAGTLGNQAFASLANQATMLAFAGKEVIQVFTKMNLVKASLVGLAMAGGAFLVNQYVKQKEAREALTEATKKGAELEAELWEQTMRQANAKNADYLREDMQHKKNLEQIMELAEAGFHVNKLTETETLRHEGRKFEIKKAAQERDRAFLELEERKKQAIRQQYAQGAVTIFGNLAAAAEAFGKKGFRAFQAFRIAEAIASTYAGAARALADYPWPFSIAVAASVVAAGIANVAQIASAKPQAHSGLDYVPQEATYKLQRGEMVLDPGTSEEVRQAARGGAGGGGGNYVVNIQLDGAVLARGIGQMSRDGRLTISARAIA